MLCPIRMHPLAAVHEESTRMCMSPPGPSVRFDDCKENMSTPCKGMDLAYSKDLGVTPYKTPRGEERDEWACANEEEDEAPVNDEIFRNITMEPATIAPPPPTLVPLTPVPTKPPEPHKMSTLMDDADCAGAPLPPPPLAIAPPQPPPMLDSRVPPPPTP